MKVCIVFTLALVAAVTASTSTNKDTTIAKDGTKGGPGTTRVYSEYGQSGVFYEFTDYVSQLSTYNFDNTIRSACNNGMWIYYEQDDYNQAAGFVVWMYGLNYGCLDFSSGNSDAISSLKYAGSPYNLNEDSFTLYQGTAFTGSEFFGQGPVFSNLDYMDNTASSMILTGFSAWTFYADTNLNGYSVCVYPDTDHVSVNQDRLDFGIYPYITNTGIPDNSISSVAKGCFSKNIVRAKKVQPLHSSGNGAMGVISVQEQQ